MKLEGYPLLGGGARSRATSLLGMVVALFVTAISSASFAVVKPSALAPPKAASAGLSGVSQRGVEPLGQLDYMVIRVDGVPHAVGRDRVLNVVRGAKILVESVALMGRGTGNFRVNVVGFEGGAGDDRGQTVATAHDLIPSFAVDKEKRTYSIRAAIGSRVLGRAYVRLVDPELKYGVVEIAGEERVVRPGDFLKLKRSDLFRVTRLETNLEDDAAATFRMARLRATVDEMTGETTERLEMQFVMGNQVFARIPVEVAAGK